MKVRYPLALGALTCLQGWLLMMCLSCLLLLIKTMTRSSLGKNGIASSLHLVHLEWKSWQRLKPEHRRQSRTHMKECFFLLVQFTSYSPGLPA